MVDSFENDIKLFMVFDILGDVVRSGSKQWNVKRVRLEDVNDHVFDLLLIYRILEKRFPNNLDFDKIFDYIICHDLPEAITGDITKFEGVAEEEIERVTTLAIDYLGNKFEGVLNLRKIINDYENRIDIESKVVKMIDKVHSASTFIKYQSEHDINVEDPGILPGLTSIPFVAEKIAEGKDVADIFYEFHIKAVSISDEECKRYSISREDADSIVSVIRGFAGEMYKQKIKGTLLDAEEDFPIEAMQYRKRAIV